MNESVSIKPCNVSLKMKIEIVVGRLRSDHQQSRISTHHATKIQNQATTIQTG